MTGGFVPLRGREVGPELLQEMKRKGERDAEGWGGKLRSRDMTQLADLGLAHDDASTPLDWPIAITIINTSIRVSALRDNL
jgi:hypothetical protein